MNRRQRRAQRTHQRDDDGENAPPGMCATGLCPACNARKIFQHGLDHTKEIRTGDDQPVIYPKGQDDFDVAVADFGIVRIEVEYKTGRFDLFALGERVFWFTPEGSEGLPSRVELNKYPWLTTLRGIREQLDRRFGPVSLDGPTHH
jgi:hypothetical protein